MQTAFFSLFLFIEKNMFINTIHLTVQAGDGGNGCESYTQRNDRKRPPSGGDGGRGGNVIFKADTNAPAISTFRFKQHLLAENGGHGGSNRCKGKNAKDLTIIVPVGTRIRDRNRGLLIRDLVENHDEVIVAAGGEGGQGNMGGRDATFGQKGQILELDLEFRLRPDYIFVGLPNSGKSTLLNLLTGTNINSEDYPFATKQPEIGVHAISDYEKVMICELPAIYTGSSSGGGHGNQFLTQMEFAQFVIYVIDASNMFAESLEQGLKILEDQVAGFDAQFAKIPSAVIVNKIDIAQESAKKLKTNLPVFYLSAKTGEGVDTFKSFLASRYKEQHV